MTKRLISLALASALALGLAACGGGDEPTRSKIADDDIDYDAPVAASPVGDKPLYKVTWTKFEMGPGVSDGCNLEGTLTNNSKEPLSLGVVTYQPIFTPEVAEHVTYASYYDMQVTFGNNLAGQPNLELVTLAPGESAPITSAKSRVNFGCEDVSELKLRYFNCAGVGSNGQQQGKRCGTASLEVENPVGAPVTR